MKNLKLSLSVVTLGIFGLVSCMNMSNMAPMTEKNINYPALYVVNGESSSISIINSATNVVTETIELMGSGANMFMFPHHIYLSPDKKSVALGVPGMDLSAGHSVNSAGMKGKMVVLDATKGMILKSVETPLMNHNAVFSPDGKEIWTSQMSETGKVLVYDATTYALKNTVNVGKMPAEVTFSADGSVAFVANGMDNTVSAINPTTKAITSTIVVGENPVGAWTGSDNKMYVDNEDGQTISIVDVKTLKVIETVKLGFMPGYAAYNSEMKELWVTDPTAGKVHWWTYDSAMKMYMHGGAFSTAAGAHAIAFNGMTAYVTNQTAGTVSVVDVMTHATTKSIPVGKKPNGIVLKP